MDETAFALSVKVLMTLYLVFMWWWLPKGRYWSVWDGFLYRLEVSILLCSDMTNMSKSGIETSAPVSSIVNVMALSMLLIC